MTVQSGEVTQLLNELHAGNKEAESKLIPLVYKELRRLAGHYLRGERADHTLQPTALVHEAYLRMTRLREVNWKNRSYFFGTAAGIMRRILVDYARSQKAKKREGFRQAVSLDETDIASPIQLSELLDLDEALERLAKLDDRRSKIVELRFFGGLSEDEIATLLDISSRTVKRDWRIARAWLFNEMTKKPVSRDSEP